VIAIFDRARSFASACRPSATLAYDGSNIDLLIGPQMLPQLNAREREQVHRSAAPWRSAWTVHDVEEALPVAAASSRAGPCNVFDETRKPPASGGAAAHGWHWPRSRAAHCLHPPAMACGPWKREQQPGPPADILSGKDIGTAMTFVPTARPERASKSSACWRTATLRAPAAHHLQHLRARAARAEPIVPRRSAGAICNSPSPFKARSPPHAG